MNEYIFEESNNDMKKLILFIVILLHISVADLMAGTAMEKVTIQLKWRHAFQFAGYYAAVEKGFYAEEGLDVTLKEFEFSGKSVIQAVVSGESEYGVGDAGLLTSYADNIPVLCVAQIFQHSPIVLISLKESLIMNPADLIGKKVAIDLNSRGDEPIRVMLTEKLGGSIDKITFMPVSFSLDKLENHEIDATTAYITDQPFRLKEKGIDVNIMKPQNFGVEFYGDNLFTTKNELASHPERVEKMMRATIKGWNYALDHPDELIDLIAAKYNTQNFTRDHLVYEAKMTDGMIMRELIPLGAVDPIRINEIINNYRRLGLTNIKGMPRDLFYRFSGSEIDLTNEEISWLRENHTIRLAVFAGQEPVVIKNSDGAFVGILNDFIHYFEEVIGVGVTFVLFEAKNGHADAKLPGVYGFATIIDSDDVEINKRYIRTVPYLKSPFNIFIGKNQLGKITGEKDLVGKKVASLAHHRAINNYLDHIGVKKVVLAANPKEQLELLQYGKADAAIGYITYHYLINKYFFNNVHFAFSSDDEYGISVGINPEHKVLRDILNKAIAKLNMEKRDAIVSKWMKNIRSIDNDDVDARDAKEKAVMLNDSEKSYLSGKGVIRMCVDPDWMPYEKVNSQGRYEGIVADYMNLFSKKIGIPMRLLKTENYSESRQKLAQGACDIIAADVATESTKEEFLTTKPYHIAPRAFAVHIDRPIIRDFNEIADEKIGVQVDSPAMTLLPKLYPVTRPIPIANTDVGLQKVATKEIDAFVNILGVVSYSIQKQAMTSVKIGGVIPMEVPLSILVNKKEAPLLPILEKAIDSLSIEDHKTISNRWIIVTYEKGVDYILISKILAGVFIVLCLLFYRQHIVKKANKKLMAAQDELTRKNEELQRLSMTDTLTGLYNRRAMEPVIDKEMGRKKRYDRPVSLMILDLDHFKRINDVFGHKAGDEVLARVADTILKNVRSTDNAARWGGEEFLVLASDTSAMNAVALAEKIRKAVKETYFEKLESITVSIGVAEYHVGEIFKDWYERADLALYQAKEEGRDRVVAHRSDADPGEKTFTVANILKLVWKDSFRSNHQLIDEQHKALYDAANLIFDSILNHEQYEIIENLLEALLEKVKEHFFYETDVLEKIGYDGLKKHSEEHKRLLALLERMISDWRKGEMEAFSFLRFIAQDLVADHFYSMDTDYFSWIVRSIK